MKLRQAVLLMDEKLPSGATLADAETLAQYEGLVSGTTGFTDFTQRAME